MEARMTLCNMSIEAGAKAGLVAVDDTTPEYVHGRPFAPSGALWDQAERYWRTLVSDADALFDRRAALDAGSIAPQVTWGTSPELALGIDEAVPAPETFDDPGKRELCERALAYMDLAPGTPISSVPVDRVFIGSCTNGRIEDFRAAAEVLAGRTIAANVTQALAVPGSGLVKRQAEAEGLDAVFRAAGFEWRDPRLLHVPGDERRPPPSRRTLGGHLQPQLRGQTRPPRPHPSGQPGHGRRRCGGRSLHRRSGAGLMEPFVRHAGVVAPLDRANVDTDQIIPKQFLRSIRPHRLRGQSVRRLALSRRGRHRRQRQSAAAESRLRAQPAALCRGQQSCSPGTTSAAAPAANTRCGPCRSTASAASWRRASRTSSSPTRRRTGCSWWFSMRR